MHCLVFTDTDLYSLTKGKSYLAKQKWRRSTCLRDQCYDVGCHPWTTFFQSSSYFKILKRGYNRLKDPVLFTYSATHFPLRASLTVFTTSSRNSELYGILFNTIISLK